jgi:hypothetical protein
VTDRIRTYSAPDLTYHGTVSELTQSQSLVVAGQVVRFAGAFANSLGGGNPPIITPGPGEVITTPTSGGGPTNTITQIGNGGAPGGGPTGASGGGAPGGGGKELPFTGLAVMGVAAIGAALASGGVTLKRIVRKPPSS